MPSEGIAAYNTAPGSSSSDDEIEPDIDDGGPFVTPFYHMVDCKKIVNYATSAMKMLGENMGKEIVSRRCCMQGKKKSMARSFTFYC
ncbi:OLC1v1003913C1 [Oldenlandia corymbosa var. corymbosa]|uniref:OLC1v1003913C1 n=1 Tax=Oldenlandia corymbosa var. corymbosa TaxID=529605 RepID=A0AAV1DB16_OLDCO|nr:OLC1v1003913C1 [Oldenlandia corymbosa var. corymbosa]